MNLRKRLNKKKKKQTLSLWDIRKLVTPGLLVTVARLKNAQKTYRKSIQTLVMRLLI